MPPVTVIVLDPGRDSSAEPGRPVDWRRPSRPQACRNLRGVLTALIGVHGNVSRTSRTALYTAITQHTVLVMAAPGHLRDHHRPDQEPHRYAGAGSCRARPGTTA